MANFSERFNAIRAWIREVGPSRASRMAGLSLGTVKLVREEGSNPTASTIEALDQAMADHMENVSSRRTSESRVSPHD